MLDLLKELVETPGISGFEEPIRNKIRSLVKDFGEVSVDGIGNLVLTTGSGKKHLAFVAHMDELGLVVSHIEQNGMIRLRKISADDRTLAGRLFNVWTKNGPVKGVIGVKAPHLTLDPEELKRVPNADRLLLDVGARSRAEVHKMGIRMLDPVIYRKNFDIINKKYLCARGLDNRIGCAALVQALRDLDMKKLKCKLTFAWSVQEEFSLRGAEVMTRLHKPDYAFAIDTFSTSDCPDAPPHYPPAYLGKGPVLRAVDMRAIACPKLMQDVTRVAKKNRIPVQVGIGGGTTDGAALQSLGIPVLPLGVPVRYSHSVVELAHMDDMVNLKRLVSGIISTPPG